MKIVKYKGIAYKVIPYENEDFYASYYLLLKENDEQKKQGSWKIEQSHIVQHNISLFYLGKNAYFHPKTDCEEYNPTKGKKKSLNI